MLVDVNFLKINYLIFCYIIKIKYRIYGKVSVNIFVLIVNKNL